MADGPRYRTLLETPEYEDQFESLAIRYSDETLEGLLLGLFWGIATNPEQYDRVTWNIRIAKSRSLDARHPSFAVLFEIIDENKVGLMWIEEINGIEELMRTR
jgi:hypothetical protein